MVEEGEFKKRIHELWRNTETPNRCLDPIEVHAQKRVLLGAIELSIDEAKKEFPEKIEYPRVGGEGEEYNKQYYDAEEIIMWLSKWFGFSK